MWSFSYIIYILYILYILYTTLPDHAVYTTLGKNHLFKNIIKKTSHFHILLYLLYKLLFLLAFSFCEVQYCNSHLLNYIFGRIPWNIAPNPGKPWVKAKAAPPWHIALCSFVALWFCDVMECATLAYYALRCHGMRYPGTLRSVWSRGAVDSWIDMAGGVGCVS